MANNLTVQVRHSWVDASGKLTTLDFNVERPAVAAGVLDLAPIEAKVTSVLDEYESVTDCKYSGASIVLPLNPVVAGAKGAAAAGSSARRHAGVQFTGEAGENGRSEIVSFHLPDPIDAAIDWGGNRPSLDSTEANTAAVIAAVIAECNTSGGEAIASYKGSFIRQRVTTPRSRQ